MELEDAFSCYMHDNFSNAKSRASLEELIAENLDYFILKHEEDLMIIQSNKLYSIFNHPKRKLKNRYGAYILLKNRYNQTNEKEILNIFP